MTQLQSFSLKKKKRRGEISPARRVRYHFHYRSPVPGNVMYLDDFHMTSHVAHISRDAPLVINASRKESRPSAVGSMRGCPSHSFSLFPSLSPRNYFDFIIFMTFRVFYVFLSLTFTLSLFSFENEARSKD